MLPRKYCSSFCRPAHGRLILSAVLIAVIGWGGWQSIPKPHFVFDQRQLASNRLLARLTKSSLVPFPGRSRYTIDSTGMRVQPGAALYVQLSEIDGVMCGRYQAVGETGALIEIFAEQKNARTLVISRTLDPASRKSDSSAFYFMVNPEGLPPGTERIALSVPATSTGAVDWRDLSPATPPELASMPTFPFPWRAFDGFIPPATDGAALFTHAPSQLILTLPIGRRRLHLKFGINPRVFSNPNNHTDGADFQITVVSPHGSEILFQSRIEPELHPAERALQPITIMLDMTAASTLHFVTGPGPHGNINFDWLEWRDFHVDPLAAR